MAKQGTNLNKNFFRQYGQIAKQIPNIKYWKVCHMTQYCIKTKVVVTASWLPSWQKPTLPLSGPIAEILKAKPNQKVDRTRGPKGHISCTWVQCATFLRNRPRQTFLFTDRPEKHKLGRDLRSCFLSSLVEFRSAVSEEKSKMSQPIRGQSGHLLFLIGLKNTNLVEDVEILLPVKFRWIQFSSFRGEVENVSANHRPGRPSYFSDLPKKHKIGRGRWDLASCQISLNFVQRFQRRSQKRLSQSEARVAILFFRSARKTQTW